MVENAETQVDTIASLTEDFTNLLDRISTAIEANEDSQVRILLDKWPSGIPFHGLDEHDQSTLIAAREICLTQASKVGAITDIKSMLIAWKSGVWGSIPSKEYMYPALMAGAIQGNADVVSLLLQKDVDLRPDLATIATNSKADIDLVPVFQAFLNHGALNIKAPCDSGEPILNYITTREGLLRWFLEQGANPNIAGSKFGTTALEAAALHSTPQIINLLIRYGAKLELCYPLHRAVHRRDSDSASIEMMAHLLVLGVDINGIEPRRGTMRPRGYFGDSLGTPLQLAAKQGKKERLLFLLREGADKSLRNLGGDTALSWAEKAGKWEMMEPLRK